MELPDHEYTISKTEIYENFFLKNPFLELLLHLYVCFYRETKTETSNDKILELKSRKSK